MVNEVGLLAAIETYLLRNNPPAGNCEPTAWRADVQARFVYASSWLETREQPCTETDVSEIMQDYERVQRVLPALELVASQQPARRRDDAMEVTHKLAAKLLAGSASAVLEVSDRPQDELLAYLRKTVERGLQRLRGRQRRNVPLSSLSSREWTELESRLFYLSPTSTLEEHEFQEWAERVLDCLTDHQASAFYDHHLLGKSIEELAVERGLTESAIYSLLARARKRLEYLDGEGELPAF